MLPEEHNMDVHKLTANCFLYVFDKEALIDDEIYDDIDPALPPPLPASR